MIKKVTIQVDLKNTSNVPPLLFGSSWGTWAPLPSAAEISPLKLKTIRAGGNLMSRYNWRTSRYSEPSNSKIYRQPDLVTFVRLCRAVNAEPIIQLNAMEWAPDKKGKFCHCLSVQDSLDLIEHLNVKHQLNVKFFEIDNEAFIWHHVHEDAWARPLSSDEYIQIFFHYASRIKKAFPQVKLFGPAICTEWSDYRSALLEKDNYGPYQSFIPYFLSRCADYEHNHGQRLLDYLSFHAYPMFRPLWNKPGFAKGGAEKYLQSTQLWWNNRYRNKYDYHQPKTIRNLLPRFKQYLDTIYPGTQLALTEFNVDAMSDFMKLDYHPAVRPLYLADFMGIAAQTGLDIFTHFHLLGWPGDRLAMIDRKKGRRPEYAIFQALSDTINGQSCHSENSLTGPQQDLLKSYVFKQDDGYSLVMLNKSEKFTFKPELLMERGYPLEEQPPYSLSCYRINAHGLSRVFQWGVNNA